MATVLQRQLAEIAAHSTHQLDLKAQKAQHARSLLFDPADASRQSFDTIYQLCREGFDDLCQLDTRFLSFASNLFADDSKSVDRGQLTHEENIALDRVVESFLGLIQSRLLLRPAQKSLEWLVRRWRVHEFTPVALLLTVLPYHKSDSLFPAVLALLSGDRELPGIFKWLHPYVASRSCPPDHAILAASVSNPAFFTAFNDYTLRIAKAGHASGILLAHWAGLVLKVVNGMLDSSRSGRANVREQKEQDILLMVLPILRDAFDVSRQRGLDEMYVGSCMLGILLATKAELADVTLNALMETVSSTWTDKTLAGGISCLVALAEAKVELSIPQKVTLRLLQANAFPSIKQLAASQRVSPLAAGFAIGLLQTSPLPGVAANSDAIREILDAEILQQQHTARIVEELVANIRFDESGRLDTSTTDLLSVLEKDEKLQKMLRHAVQTPNANPLISQALYEIPGASNVSENSDAEMEMVDAQSQISTSENTQPTDIVFLLDNLPQLPHEQYSFLNTDLNGSDFFQAYCSVFCTAISSKADLAPFLDRLLGASSTRLGLTLLTFLARLWSTAAGHVNTHAKVKALNLASHHIEHLLFSPTRQTSEATASQLLYLYVLIALAEDNQPIRMAAARLCISCQKLITDDKVLESSKSTTEQQDIIYGARAVKGISWLSSSDSRRFINELLVPILDDCVLDPGFLKRFLIELLGAKASDSNEKTRIALTKVRRNAIHEFLASHAAHTPVMRTRLFLLQILGSVFKGAEPSRTRFLLPLLKEWASASELELQNLCDREGVSLHEIDESLFHNMWQCSGDAIQQVREVCLQSKRQNLVELAFDQQQRSWATQKSTQTRLDVIQWLLSLILDRERCGESIADLALQTLRALEMNSEILLAILETLPRAADLQSQSPPTKKQRRTSDTAQDRSVAQGGTRKAIREITLLLELLEQSQSQSSKLLQPLFSLLAELRHFKSMVGSDLTYLHSLTLDSLLSVVRKVQELSTSERPADWNFVRIDLLVDCIRTSASPQVQNTAVLLVSALASWIPDSVLHSVMPLFTFMSTTVLQRNDEYSAHITEQAIARIVPVLASSLRTRGQSVLVGVSEMLLSFVAAWEHVPLHRRMLTFEMVVDAVGAQSCLGAMLAMLAERYPETGVPVSNFIVNMLVRRSAVETVTAANQWLELVTQGMQAPDPKRKRELNVPDLLFGMAEKDNNERADTLERLINALRDLVGNNEIKKALAGSLGQITTDELQSVYLAYASLLENATGLFQDISKAKSLTMKAPILMLSAILDLLPTTDFIASSAEIMQAGSDTSRRMVLQSLESRVQACRSSNVAESRTFINLLPSCSAFIRHDLSVDVIAAAIGCIDAICEKFGRTNPVMVRDAAGTVTGEAALGSKNTRLRTLSLLCLASMAAVLEDGDESLSVLPPAISLTLDCLASDVSTAERTAEQDAGFRLLTAVLDHSPWMLTTNPEQLDKALASGVKSELKLSEAVRDFLTLAARKTSARELFASVGRVCAAELQTAEDQGVSSDTATIHSMRTLIDVFHQAVNVNSRATITKNASTIFRFLLDGFDVPRRLRAIANGSENHDLQSLGSAMDNATLDVTLKMNDATFRPFYSQLVDWATTSSTGLDANARLERGASLYRFSLLLFERLGALVVNYMSFLLDSACETLLMPVKSPSESDLLRLVIKALDSSFRGDEDDFWTAPAHFDQIQDPLINRLCAVGRYMATEDELLIEAISNLAAAVSSSPDQLKRINTRLLSVLRHQHADVRLAALQSQRAITAKVNFDWLTLLPEMLPVISELQEDDDERVEQETLRWVKEIEDISGENLEGMLA